MFGVKRKYIKVADSLLGVDFADFLFEATEAVLSSYGMVDGVLNKIADGPSIQVYRNKRGREISIHKWQSGSGGYVESEYDTATKRRIYFELKEGKLYMKKKPEERPEYSPGFLEELRRKEYDFFGKNKEYRPHFESDNEEHNAPIVDERLLQIGEDEYGGRSRPYRGEEKKKQLVN